MRSARDSHAAVRVPEHGFLSIGGWNIGKWLKDMKLLQLTGNDEGAIWWPRIPPILQKKKNGLLPATPEVLSSCPAGSATFWT